MHGAPPVVAYAKRLHEYGVHGDAWFVPTDTKVSAILSCNCVEPVHLAYLKADQAVITGRVTSSFSESFDRFWADQPTDLAH